MANEEARTSAVNEKFLKAFFKYGLVIMLLASLLVAFLSGAL